MSERSVLNKWANLDCSKLAEAVTNLTQKDVIHVPMLSSLEERVKKCLEEQNISQGTAEDALNNLRSLRQT